MADPLRNKSLERFAVLGKKYRNTVDDGAVGGSETQPRPERKGKRKGRKYKRLSARALRLATSVCTKATSPRVLLFDKLKNDAPLVRLKSRGSRTAGNNEVPQKRKPTKSFNH